MKKCGILYDEILKSKSVASRNLDYGYMKTLDVIRRSNMCERRRWVGKMRHEHKHDLHETYDVEKPLENPPKLQTNRKTRNNTNKIKAEIQRKSLHQHIKKKRTDVKEGMLQIVLYETISNDIEIYQYLQFTKFKIIIYFCNGVVMNPLHLF